MGTFGKWWLRRSALGLSVVSAGLAVFTGCSHTVSPETAHPATPEMLTPSPRLIVGRIIAVDAAQAFAFVELNPDAPAGAQADGTELICRTLELKETARLRASRYVRGRTLGTKILAGQPSPNDEVVWLAP